MLAALRATSTSSSTASTLTNLSSDCVFGFVFVATFSNSILCSVLSIHTDATGGIGRLTERRQRRQRERTRWFVSRTLDAARHAAYCKASVAIGNENETNAAQQQQCRDRARRRRRQQRQICNIANTIFESAAVCSQFAPVVLLGVRLLFPLIN
jgi:hypothetical protein